MNCRGARPPAHCHPAWVEDGDNGRDSFFGAVVGDGRPLLLVTAGALFFAGGFAL